MREISQYLDALSPSEKSTPLSLLLAACAVQMNELLTRSIPSIDDAIEKEKRDRSVVIQGLTESDASKASERVADDTAKVIAMLDLAELEHTPCAVFRMGEKSVSRPRLLKVMFHTRSAQSSFLAKSRSITTKFTIPNVHIRPSLTKEEREEAYKQRQELRKMKADGKDVILYAGSIIEKSQLDAVKKQLRAARPQRPPRTPATPSALSFSFPNTTKNQ